MRDEPAMSRGLTSMPVKGNVACGAATVEAVLVNGSWADDDGGVAGPVFTASVIGLHVVA
jgi:hypothetical protein